MKQHTGIVILRAVVIYLLLLFNAAFASPFSFDVSQPVAEPGTGAWIGTVTATVSEGHMLYRGQISATADGGSIDLHLPQGHRKKDPFGPGEIEIYDTGSWPFGITLTQSTASAEVMVELGYQGCSTLTCFMPDTYTFGWPIRGAKTTATSMDFGRTIRERGLLFAMLMAFFGGLLVSLTPCVYPMIPITLSIIGSRDENRTFGRGFVLSVSYVAGLSLTYALLGLAVASFGAHLRGFIQNVWFQGAMAAVFALLALSMFDVFMLQVPEAVRNRLAGFKSGGFAGVFLTGMVSGLMASPCVAAPLAGILAFIASTGSALFGFLLLLSFAWGMGLLLIALGTFSGVINSLPRSGEWMNRVKEFYGFLLFGAALYFVRPLVGAPWGDLGVSLLLAAFAGFLGLFTAPTPDAPLGERVRKSIAVVALVVACAFAVSSVSRWGGLGFPSAGADRATGHATAMNPGSSFPRWHSNLQDALSEAKKYRRPVFVDFRADWCAICRELEENVFQDREVVQRLAKYVLVRIDATGNEREAAELLTRYRVIGLPTLIHLRPDGSEREDLRIVGDIQASALVEILEKGLH